jgi:hypothetical protein
VPAAQPHQAAGTGSLSAGDSIPAGPGIAGCANAGRSNTACPIAGCPAAGWPNTGCPNTGCPVAGSTVVRAWRGTAAAPGAGRQGEHQDEAGEEHANLEPQRPDQRCGEVGPDRLQAGPGHNALHAGRQHLSGGQPAGGRRCRRIRGY